MIDLFRVKGMVLRHYYVHKQSPARLVNMIGWPAVNMLLWGFMNSYLAKTYGGEAYIAGTLIAGAVCWDVYMRACWGTTTAVYEEFWFRTLGQIHSTPLRPAELILSYLLSSLYKLAFTFTIITIMVMLLFGFNFFSIGWDFILYLLP
ncbi:MAG: hypothetical protein GC136_01925 [Alphaproteobacteria bacterium]|nr:hypothetical protein [Alphaproteobacteria bacterium]